MGRRLYRARPEVWQPSVEVFGPVHSWMSCAKEGGWVMVHFVGSIVSLALLFIFLVASGCAIHYFDTESGTEHIWGVGHMAMKPSAPTEGLNAVARRTDIVGISIGKLQEGTHLEIGWGRRQRIEIINENTQLCLAWPRGSFYNARIGAAFPPKLDDCGRDTKEK